MPHITVAEQGDAEPLAVDIELPEEPTHSSHAESEPASPSTLVPKSVFADDSVADVSCQVASTSSGPYSEVAYTMQGAAAQKSTCHRRQVRPAGDSPQSATGDRSQQQERAQPRRPQPLDIPRGSPGRDEHAALVGSPTTTAPIVAQIRRSRSTDAEAPADLHTASSGGLRLGPGALVRAVGRAIRSVVGGDSDDTVVPLVRSSRASLHYA